MNMIRPTLLLTAFAASFAGASSALCPALAADRVVVAMSQCAGGFHADAQGNCQPNEGYVDSRCPPGYEAEPFPNGNDYHCVPYGG